MRKYKIDVPRPVPNDECPRTPIAIRDERLLWRNAGMPLRGVHDRRSPRVELRLGVKRRSQDMNGPLINFDQAVDIARLVSANNWRRVHGRREEYCMRVLATISQ